MFFNWNRGGDFAQSKKAATRFSKEFLDLDSLPACRRPARLHRAGKHYGRQAAKIMPE